jgi:glutamate N-acetyltransferase/amino-acid N-acetyltransferase
MEPPVNMEKMMLETPPRPRMRASDSRPVLPIAFKASGVHCGIRRKGTKLDLGLIVADAAYPAAAVYTQNRLTGAHVGLCKESLAKTGGRVRALLVNSGNANCSTGAEGVADARRIRNACAELIGCPPDEVLYLSTGVIGARLPVEKILDKLPQLCASASVNGLGDFAQAIMTTDLVPKVRTLVVEDRSGPPFRVTGIAKGSGMIHPNMATMFGFVISDAPAPGAVNASTAQPSTSLSKAQASQAPAAPSSQMLAALRALAAKSFNRVTVDGDTSPNDTMILWCSGGATTAGGLGRSANTWEGAQRQLFDDAVLEVSCELCRAIATDGEGATRLVTVDVRGAPSEEAAAHVARTIATSPLTKTAVHGRDPNWGRILAAAGRAGVEFDVDRARVWIGEADVYSNGKPHPENEPAAHLHLLQNHEVILGIDLGAGTAGAQAWTCDFSADYVRINADYRS